MDYSRHGRDADERIADALERIANHVCRMDDGSAASILQKLNIIIDKENQLMALGQDILDKVTAEGTLIDSIIALIQGLVASGTIDAATAAAITAKLDENRTKLEAAIAANTTPPPTP